MIDNMNSFLGNLPSRIPDADEIRIEAEALRDAMTRLREDVSQDSPNPRIVRDVDAAVNAHRVLSTRVERHFRGRAPGRPVLLIREIGNALNRIQQESPDL